MGIFFEVGTITNPSAEPFALIMIDTDKIVGDQHGTGVEGVVISCYWTKDEAEAAALLARAEAVGFAS